MKNLWACIEVVFAGLAIALVVLFCIYAFHERSEGAAAWVQAVGSVAAILASAWLTRWQLARQQKHDKDTALALSKNRVQLMRQVGDEAFSLIQQICDNLRTNEEIREYFSCHFDLNHFTIVQSALDEISLWDLPSADLIMPIITIKKSMARALASAGKIQDKARAIGPGTPPFRDSDAARTILEERGYAELAIGRIDAFAHSLKRSV